MNAVSQDAHVSSMSLHGNVVPTVPNLGHGGEKTSISWGNSQHLNWYHKWLDTRFKLLPLSITERLSSPSTIFSQVAKSAKNGDSIGDIAIQLLSMELINSKEAEDAGMIARSITFAVLGWQTMLYEPAFGTCPPSQLAIADVLDGYAGQAFMTLKQDQSRVKRPLPDFLLGFGLMLPRENLCLSADEEDCQAFEKLSIIMPNELNAMLIQSLSQIKIKWIDVLAPHLEFDKATNTLFLFRYPSFCMANIPSGGETDDEGVLHCCATKYSESDQWASKSDITQLLHEILLSYRLLFGQSKASRRLFQSTNVFEGQSNVQDALLKQLCSDKDSPLSVPDRAFYRLSRDFPILRSRIAILQRQMSSLKPRGWKEIWHDKRDSAQWLTFWAVIIIGGSGILLSLVQVILQAAQLAGAR